MGKFRVMKELEGLRREDVMMRWFRVFLGGKDSAGSSVLFRVFERSIKIEGFLV